MSTQIRILVRLSHAPLLKTVLTLAALLVLHVVTVTAEDDGKDLSKMFQDFHQKLLDRHPVEFLFDDDASGPIVNPSEFALGGTVHVMRSLQGYSFPKEFEVLDTEQGLNGFWRWLNDTNVNSNWSSHFELAPDRRKLRQWRQRGKAIEMNKEAATKGKGLFADIRLVEGETSVYTLKYMLFMAYNKASGPEGYGDHEGDWMCIDLQIETGKGATPDDFTSEVTCVIFHHHGDHTIVPANKLRRNHEGAIQVFLEEGSNEPFPEPGPAKPIFNNFGVVRKHMGKGMSYLSRGKVRDIRYHLDLDAKLMFAYQGQWGEADIDPQPWKNLLGDVTNPPSPLYQDKMWKRKGLPTDRRWHPCR